MSERDLDLNALKMYSFLVFSKLEGAVKSRHIDKFLGVAVGPIRASKTRATEPHGGSTNNDDTQQP